MKTKLQMTLLGLAFAAPVLIATAMQTPWLHYQPESTKNYGQVLSPAPTLAQWLPADPLPATEAGRWSLLYLGGLSCDQACLEQIDLSFRIWQAQGTERERLRLLYLTPAQGTPPSLDQHWQLGAVPDSGLNGVPTTARVVLVDPEGFAATWYAADFDPSGLRKDVRHLLKWSKGGR